MIFVMAAALACYPQDYTNSQLDSMGRVAIAMPDDTAKLSLFEELAYNHHNVDSTMKYAILEYELADKLGDNHAKAMSLGYQSWCYNYMGEYSKSISYGFRSLGLVDPVGNEDYVASCWLLLAYNYYGLGDFDRADDLCRRALQIFDQTGNQLRVSETLRTLCLFCIEYNFYDMGQYYLERAYAIDHGVYLSSEVEDLLHYGYTDYLRYTSGKHPDKIPLLHSAIAKLREAENLAMQIEYEDGYVGILEKLSMSYLALAESEINDPELRNVYADSSLSVCHRGMQFATKLGYESFLLSLQMLETQALIVKREQRITKFSIKDITDRFFARKEHMLSLGDRYYALMLQYYKMLGDYKTAMQYIDKLRQFSYDRYNFDLGTKIYKIHAQENYDRYLYEYENRNQERDRDFEIDRERRDYYNMWLLVIVLFLVFLIMLTYIDKTHQHQITRKLVRQNNAIDIQNLELKHYGMEFEKLKEKYNTERHELEVKKAEFLEANRYITVSLNNARKIQNMLLPSRAMMNQLFGDCLIYWKPLQTVSGDFYWANRIRQYRIAVAADCTGHGVPGAFMSMLGISTLNDIVSSKGIGGNNLTAAMVLEKMRSKIIQSLRQNSEGHEQYDCMDMSVLILHDNSHTMQYAGANRPILIAGASGVAEIAPDEMPAGYDLLCNAPFTNHILEYRPGDVVYMYSDGITDQFGGKNGKMKFGSKRLKALIEDIHTLDFSEQLLRLQMATDEWTTCRFDSDCLVEIYRPQLDDQLLLGIKLS